MKKYFPHLSTLLLTLAIVFVVGGFMFPQTIRAQTFICKIGNLEVGPPRISTADECEDEGGEWIEATQEQQAAQVASKTAQNPGVFIEALQDVFAWIVGIILQFVSLLTGLAAVVLNGVIYYTVVKVSENYASIPAISEAWRVIRDVANMAFIFVLLYAAIQTILGIGSDTQKLIRNIIVVAILINFSLFFTKVVIDASNVLALMFYDAIAPGALAGGTVDTILGRVGLSDAFMQHLSLTSLYKVGENLGVANIISIGILGSIMLLVAAFVFFAVAIMFIIRYVVLILVLILSPLAFIAYILPALQDKWKQWVDALIGQAFFAPIYFMLTWVTLHILGGIMGSFGGTATGTDAALSGLAVGESGVALAGGSFVMLINFIVVIVFLIASLTIAKEWANKAPGGVSKLTGWAMGAAGGAAFGGLGWAGRTTFGRAGATAAESARLQEAANKQRAGAWDRTKGATARLALYASKKARSGSFDARSATIPTSAVGALIEGTAGRTRVGRALGLNDVPIPSVQVGAFAAGQTGVGEGGKKGFVDTREESGKRVHEREAKAADEWAQAQARRDVNRGARVGASPAEVDAMEKALSHLTDKQTETLVTNNRELLKLQNFANAISVKQLDALNKSDQFSEAEKDTLKARRFGDINAALAVGGAGAASVRQNIRRLSDTELEMIDPSYLGNPDFVSQLQPAQIDAINKGTKFTTSQKSALRTVRRAPLLAAVAAGNVANARDAARELGHKEIAGLDMTVLQNATMLQVYTPQMLKRMAQEMNSSDIPALRADLVTGGSPAVQAWLAANPDNFS
ncbi:MAG: hypothetical protein Q8P21_01835 [bacterium]|nr:hypothetical protein [bacterium]